MVEMLFSLRYQSQIRRTRPRLFAHIEHSITDAVKRSGGKLGHERRYIAASFEGQAIGFWLDILMILETILKNTEEAASELYGYRCILGRDLGDDRLSILRSLPIGESGFWCAPSVQKELTPYAVFEEQPPPWEAQPMAAGFARIRNIRTPQGALRSPPYREQVLQALQTGEYRNAVFVGPRFTGKREGLHRYCAAVLEDIPPLAIRFGSGGKGVSCFADAYNSAVRSFLSLSEKDGAVQELDALARIILRERLRDQYSPYLFQKAQYFLTLLLESYGASVSSRGKKALIILENIHEAGGKAVQIFTGVWQHCRVKGVCRVFGTCVSQGDNGRRFEETGNEGWRKVFSRVVRFPEGEAPQEPVPDLPQDLWEIAYALSLFRLYFPPAKYSELFEEAGKNPLTFYRALDIFSRMALNDLAEDPLLRIESCATRAEEILGERQESIRAMVRSCLLSWVEAGKLKPCFNLLKALSDLGGEASTTIIRDSLTGDILNGTFDGVEQALEEGYFGKVVGEGRLAPLRYIFKTLKALSHGGEAEIREVFSEPMPDAGAFPGYQAQILSNVTGYYFAIGDIAAAAETAKQAMMISQSLREEQGLAQSYRLFSLVNLARQRTADALEYLNFAIERSGASADYDELTITVYYAAAVHFLFGNLSQAGRLARQAEETAESCGRIDWADRARFLLGRLQFETGHYREALEIFEGLQKEEIVYPLTAAASGRNLTLAAWIYRCDVYARNPVIRVPRTMNGDALLFEVEAAYLSGDYERAVNLSEKLRNTFLEGGILFIEQPDWRSGFSQCELLFFPHRDFFTRLLSCYRSLALCRSQNAAPGEAVEGMRRVIKEEGLPDTDPNDAFYFYAYYQVLQELGAVEVDMNTAVSIAFKRLQRRASRIDELETKRDYLTLNHWNKALGQAAKLHNLI